MRSSGTGLANRNELSGAENKLLYRMIAVEKVSMIVNARNMKSKTVPRSLPLSITSQLTRSS